MGTPSDDPLSPGYYTPGQPTPLVPPILAPVRNFRPPPTTPDYFGRSDQPGSRAQHQVSPSDYDKPGGTQTAAMPVPPRAPAGENIDQPTLPTPGSYRPPPLYTPPALPWRDQQPPPAEPAPPLGHWTTEDDVPKHVQPKVTLAPPNRQPDAYKGGAPVYYLRPGERGYGQLPAPLLGVVAQLESSRRPDMNPQTYGQKASFEAAYGRGPQGVLSYANKMLQANPRATLGDFYAGYLQGTADPAHPPSLDSMRLYYPREYRNLTSNQNYPLNTPLASLMGGAVSAPVQSYIAPRGREPSQWGEPPDNEWTPGRMPQSHDMPGIMHGLLPLIGTILIGFAGKGALGAVTAFGAYQNARNKGQLEAAKEQKDLWKNSLSETTSRLKEEMIAAQGVMADYPDASSPQAQMAWRKIAATFDDSQLSAALDSNDMKRVEDLFKRRDSVFQTLSKTTDAANRADTELADKQRRQGDVNEALGEPRPAVREPGGATTTPSGPDWSMGGGRGAPAVPAPAAPAAPEEGQPQPQAQPGEQPPSEVPQPSEVPPPPADGQPTPQVAPPLATGPAGARPPVAGGAPAPAPSPAPPPIGGAPTPQTPAPTGTPSATLPPVSVTAPLPRDDPLARLSPQEQAIARDVLAGGEMPKLPPEAAAMEAKIGAAVAGLNQRLRQVSENPTLRDEKSIVGAVRGVDPLTADNLAAIAHNMMPLPGSESGTSGSGGSRGVLGYRNLMSNLARKVNPQWDPGQWGGIEKFRDPGGQTQQAIGRIAAIGDAGTRLKYYLDLIKDDPVTFHRMVEFYRTNHFTNNPIYSNMFQAWQTLMIDSNALTSGKGLEGETEQIITSIPLYGNKNSYLGAVKFHAGVALARYDQYKNQWAQYQRTDSMFGHNEVAEKQVRDLANIEDTATTPGGSSGGGTTTGSGGFTITPVH